MTKFKYFFTSTVVTTLVLILIIGIIKVDHNTRLIAFGSAQPFFQYSSKDNRRNLEFNFAGRKFKFVL